MSAEANLAGLFKPFGYQVWNEKIKWQPVPVHTVPQQDDSLMGFKRCDHFDYVMLQWMNTSAYTNLFIKYKSLIEYLESNSGAKLSTLAQILLLYDALYIQQLKGLRFVSLHLKYSEN